MTCQNKPIVCGKVECRGCGANVVPNVATDAEKTKTMKPHDWIVIMHALAIAGELATDSMREEIKTGAKADHHYKASLDGRSVP